MDGIRLKIIKVLGIILTFFLLYTAGFGQFSPMIQRGFPFLIATVLIFLIYPMVVGSKIKDMNTWQWAVTLVCLAGSVVAIGYVMYFQEDIAMRLGRSTTADFIISVIGILITLEITRRSTAPALAYIAIFFLAYALFGQYLPGIVGHRELDLTMASVYIFLSQEGIFGSSIDVMVSFIYIFVTFGAFLEVTGAGRAFINLAYSITGKLTGGPSLTAIVASSLFGLVSGSPVANVSGVGTFTIPLMKKTGNEKHFAAAVEAAASTGGQIMPPVMGASAFLMAEILSMPYIQIAYRAFIPAILFYMCLFLTVYLRAKKAGLKGLPANELPSTKDAFLEGWHMFSSLIVLIGLLVLNVSPAKAAFFATVLLVATSMTRPSSRLTLQKFLDALVASAKGSLGIFSALACVGIIIGVISLTGLGVKFSILVTAAAGNSLLLALVFVAIASLILGMGLPPVAAYLLLVVIAGPAIEGMGAALFTAHMFVFYFSAMAPITPPVALAAYTAAGIADCDPMKAGLIAARLGMVGFIVPFMFVYAPELLLYGGATDVIWALITAASGIVMLAAASEGFFMTALPWYLRITTTFGGLLLVYPGLKTDLIGIGLAALFVLYQVIQKKKEGRAVNNMAV